MKKLGCATFINKSPLVFAVVLFSAFATVGFAFSPLVQITPERPGGMEWVSVSSARLANGDIEFAVSISIAPKQWRYDISTDLRQVYMNAHGEGARGLRRLSSEQDEGVIYCVFSVTQKELEDPDLSYVLAYGDLRMWRTYIFFVRLRKFLPP